MTDDTGKNKQDRKRAKPKVIRAESAGDAALKEAEELYKRADKKVNPSAKEDRRTCIDALVTATQNAATKGDQTAV